MTFELIEKGVNCLGDYVEKALSTYSANDAYHCLGKTHTFAEIERLSRHFACWLQHEAKLSPGDRFIIQLPNLTQYPIAAYAAMRAGLIIVNTNPLYTPREMLHQFKDSGAKAIIILDSLLPKLEAVIEQTDIETVIITQADDLLTGQSHEYAKGHCFNQAMALGQQYTLQPRATTNLDDVCVLQYTGGTTGVSKGASLTHRNIIANTAQTGDVLCKTCIPGEEIFVCPLPLYHIYAFSVNMMLFFGHGNLNVLITNPRDLDAFVATIKPFKFSGFAGLNTLFVGLCHHEGFKALDFSKLKLTISGGTTLTIAAANIWRETTGCTVSEGYGLSETAPVVCMNEPGNEQIGSIGRPLIDTVVEIWDFENNPLPDGEEGELVLKGPQLMQGYWNMPQETAKVMVNGFFKTGDIATKRPNGCIKIVDRLKDMIIVSGFNVYPNEVEEVLVSYSGVLEAAVVGQADERTGEKVCAFISVEGDFDCAALEAYCREQLTAYKVPKEIKVLEAIPKSTVGKILRRELRNP